MWTKSQDDEVEMRMVPEDCNITGYQIIDLSSSSTSTSTPPTLHRSIE